MRRTHLALALATLMLAACGREQAAPAAGPETAPPPAPSADYTVDPLEAAVAGEWRTPEFVARDAYRNPAQTLAFFGVRPDMTVVEITPGGGWYAEILAPFLAKSGSYVGAVVDPATTANERAREYWTNANAGLREKLERGGEAFGAPVLVEYDPANPSFGAAGSADAVLTFRNVHNWMMNGQAEGMFAGFFSVLKPGGVLGVVEHRAAGDVPEGDRSGYVGQDQVIALAEAAGFVLEESSEINANPADTKDHPNGVWTLPPTNRHDEADAEKYRAIGESDRMTLRFRKPA